MDFSAQNPRSLNDLSLAARKNDVKSVRRLISKINPNCVDNRGWTCLHEAAFHDSLGALKVILKSKLCRPLVESHEGHTALYVACLNIFSTRCIKYLLEKVEGIANYSSREGFTPLHLASLQGRNDVVQMLIDHGAIIDAVDFDGDTPLHEACQSRNHEIVNILLQAGASPEIKNEDKVTPLHMACARGSLKSVQYLLPFISDINVIDRNGDTPLIASTHGENEELIQFLLENGADPNVYNNFSKLALDIALEKGFVKAFKFLFEVTAIDKINKNLVYRALTPSYLNIEIVEILFKSNLDSQFFMYNESWSLEIMNKDKTPSLVPNYRKISPLSTYLNVSEYIYTLSPEKFRECFYLALMKGLSVNAVHVEEMPPLVWLHYCPHAACFEEVLELLVHHGCNVDYCSNTFSTRNNECIQMLLPPLICKEPFGDLNIDETTHFPDVFCASLLAGPYTLPKMIPYSFHCDPDKVLRFAYDTGLIERISHHTQEALIKMIDSESEVSCYGSFKNHVLPLKHLSRLKVREIIKSKDRNTKTTRQYLEILNTLPIPNVIKNYLRFL